jgi:hypothetical protein
MGAVQIEHKFGDIWGPRQWRFARVRQVTRFQSPCRLFIADLILNERIGDSARPGKHLRPSGFAGALQKPLLTSGIYSATRSSP